LHADAAGGLELASDEQGGAGAIVEDGPLGNQAAIGIGPHSIVTPLNEAGLGRAGAVVRGQVRRAGHVEPWPMLSLDGLGLIVEDLAGAGPMLVWSDWQSGERVELPGVSNAQLISSRHFIAEADG